MSDLCTNCKKKPATEDFKPFCSKRCADVDLHRWLSGGYVIPGRDGEAVVPANDVNPDADPELK